MTLLYQPLSRTFGQRDGCLTPNNYQEDKSGHQKTSRFAQTSPFKSTFADSHDILSPPLSPYQRSSSHDADGVHTHTLALNGLATKSYMQTSLAFKVEDFKSYLLTVVPWNNLSTNYKQRHMRFLDQYASMSSKDYSYLHSLRLAERRAAHAGFPSSRKRHIRSSSDDSDSDAVERVRTRRIVKENLAPLSEIEVASNGTLPSPKKRKVRKDTPYAGSPLAVQQAALIDESIPDYSPDPYTTLPKGNNRCLKIEWKGQPMDLKNDANVDKLHPAEVLLASTLRLPCNVYLDSKRRLFYEKVNRMRSGMPFRRTDAQKACRIDVNKASRLFAAFEKVGWLNDSHFTGHI